MWQDMRSQKYEGKEKSIINLINEYVFNWWCIFVCALAFVTWWNIYDMDHIWHNKVEVTGSWIKNHEVRGSSILRRNIPFPLKSKKDKCKEGEISYWIKNCTKDQTRRTQGASCAHKMKIPHSWGAQLLLMLTLVPKGDIVGTSVLSLISNDDVK